MANKCTFCGGNHTETKCPTLEGHIQHMLNVINRNKGNSVDWDFDLDTLFHRRHPENIWRKFASEADTKDLLGKPTWRWWNMIRTYKKRLNYKKAGEKRRGQKRTRAIKCGYCGKSGHTRRTCAKLKADTKILISDTALRRAMFIDACRDLGLGVGSLVKLKLNEYGLKYKEAGYSSFQDEEFIVMLTQIPVQSITAFSNERGWSPFYTRAHFVFKPLTGEKAKDGTDVSIVVNRMIFDGRFNNIVGDTSEANFSSFYDIEVVSKSSDMSWNKKDGDKYLDHLKKKSRNHFENHIAGSKKWVRENK